MDQRLVDDALARHQRILLPHIIPVDEDVVLLRLAPLGTHEAEGLLMIVPHDLAAAELSAVQKRAFLRWCPQVLKMIIPRREARRHSRMRRAFGRPFGSELGAQSYSTRSPCVNALPP